MGYDFERVEQVLAEATARTDPAERTAFLNQACGEDRQLRAQVERLLAAGEQAGDFLETPLEAPAGVDGPTEAGLAGRLEGPGSIIGHYKLLEEIGEGGFGIVYMAEQTEPVQRKVALKIIKPGMDTREVVARFEAERQALALMDHPNIARVFDGGVVGGPDSALCTLHPSLPQGRPYFVMELVRGIPITEFCDQRKLSTPERLKLFIQVCQAVQHAHQKGIIHRDLKPSNILVTLVDGQPVPKVIDFGVAKALGQKLTDKTLFTGFLKMIGTPVYMSPEQADLSGVDIDTRADIYALGVLLYELLTGVTPFDKETLCNAALDEIRRMIRETEPPKPSTRLRTLGQKLTTVAEQRQTEPGALSRVLRGDLDWIVMKCLEKDRGRRYETANALAEDIRRHMQHEVVAARSPSMLYLAGKFAYRHKTGLGIAGVMVLLLAGGAVVSTWQAVRATKAERVQALLRDEAEQAREAMETRAYGSEMSLAAYSANAGGNLGNVQNRLFRWRDTRPDRRGWEWYYLNGLCHREILTLKADTQAVLCVAWSPDGKRLASGGDEGVVRVWDSAIGLKIAELRGHTERVRWLAWSPDGRRLATASWDDTARIWNAETGTQLLMLTSHKQWNVYSVAWSRDGTKLASVSGDRKVKIWDTATGNQLFSFPTAEHVTAMSWDPGCTRLALSSMGETSVLDLLTGKSLLAVSEGGAVSWSPDGKWLAMGGDLSRVRLTDAVSGTPGPIVARHNSGVKSVAWSPDATRLASTSSGDGMVKIVEVKSCAELQVFRGHAGAATAVEWRPDGEQIASGGLDGTVKVWDANAGDPRLTIRTQPSQVLSLAWHPDNRRLASSASNGEVRIWDADAEVPPILLAGQASWVRQVAWNPAGTRLASGGWGGLVIVWQQTDGAPGWQGEAYTSIQGNKKDARCVTWSPDGKRLAAGAEDGLLRIWDTSSGRLLVTANVGDGNVLNALAWSADGLQLALGIGGGGLKILESADGTVRHTLMGHRDGVRSVAWSPDGRRLASASDDTTIGIWDRATGRQLQMLVGHSSHARSVAWSPEGTRLATGSVDCTVRIWDPATGQEVCSLSEIGRTGWVFAVAWSPDGNRIASGDLSGNIMIHDSTRGRIFEENIKPGEFKKPASGNQPTQSSR